MTPFEHLVATPVAKALGWALFHSLWEGTLAALLLQAALLVRRSPRARYAAACTAMLAMLAGFALTFLIRLPKTGGATIVPHAIPRAPLGSDQLVPGTEARFPIEAILPWPAPFWMAGVLLFQLRGTVAWIAARRLRRPGVCRPLDAWLERLDQLRVRLRLSQTVALLEPCMAEVPVVIGYLRPAILAPAGLLAGMPASQVESILLHELAHIRHGDYLANLLQTVLEGSMFYHPAVWWISGVIRAEREECCDDLVVAASGDAYAYAAALAALEQTRWAAHQAAVAATGASLVKRMQRLLYEPKGSALAPAFSAGILTLAVASALAGWQASIPAPAAPSAWQTNVDPYTRWLTEDVVYIIGARERAAYLGLKTETERYRFIQQFWERRNPSPGSLENAFKIEHYRRIAFADSHFGWRDTPGWKTDRGRAYIMFGPPDEIESHPAGPAGYPVEEWLYHHIKGIGDQIIAQFADVAKTGDFRMEQDPGR